MNIEVCKFFLAYFPSPSFAKDVANVISLNKKYYVTVLHTSPTISLPSTSTLFIVSKFSGTY